jgi:hypothetical protein
MNTFKFNWGHGIAIFFSAFVVFILTAVFTSTHENIHLVTENYYAEELAYQQRIDEIENTNQLKGEVSLRMNEGKFELTFPETKELLSGKIQFFRPSDSALDKVFAVNTDTNGKQLIATKGMVNGYYRVKITWQMAGKSYYKEEPFYLP